MYFPDECISGKRCYVEKKDAEDALIHSRITNGFSGARNIYICDDCGTYHLTSRGEISDVIEKRRSEIEIAREAQRFKIR
jgi:hypothetical protein